MKKKTLSKPLSLVKISARVVDIWQRYLNFILHIYLWAILYIQIGEVASRSVDLFSKLIHRLVLPNKREEL